MNEIIAPGVSERRLFVFPRPGVLVRHGLAILLLWGCNRFLENWYAYWSRSDYILFASCYGAAFLLAAGPWLVSILKTTPRSRLWLFILLLLVLLPWGEWLQLNMASSREAWSRQIVHETVFLYAVVALLRLVPQLADLIEQTTLRVLNNIASWKFAAVAFPVAFFFYAAWIGIGLYGKVPIVQDSAAQLFQAKIFAKGTFTAPAPPVPDAFNYLGTFLAMHHGRWFCMYQPGLSLMLAPFLWIHAEWFLCPLLGALTLALWMDYIRRWHNPSLAVVFAILFLVSPFTSLMSSTVMIHTPEIFLASSCIYCCRRESENSSVMRSVALFFLFLLVMIVRPFSILPCLAPVLLFTLHKLIQRRQWGAPIAMALGIAAGSVLLGYYYLKTTGDPATPPYRIVHPDYRYGFGRTLEGQLHTPARGLENTSNHLLGMDLWLNGFYSGSLFFLLALILLRKEFALWDRILFLSCCCLVAFYFGFVVQDLVFGPRYFYILAPLLLLFVSLNFDFDSTLDAGSSTVIAAALIVSFVTFLPDRLPYFLNSYNPADNQSRVLQNQLSGLKKPTLVFLDPLNLNFINWNDPFLKGPFILCRNRGAENPEVEKQFSRYTPGFFEQTMTRDFKELGYRIIEAPSSEDPNKISLFSVAMTIQAANNYSGIDVFDLGFGFLFPGSDVDARLRNLDAREQSLQGGTGYRDQLAFGLIHLGKWVLLAKSAMQKHGNTWKTDFDLNQFRSEYSLTSQYLKNAGEVGKPELQALEKTFLRIDQNRDGSLSNEEILAYLDKKFRSIRGDR